MDMPTEFWMLRLSIKVNWVVPGVDALRFLPGHPVTGLSPCTARSTTPELKTYHSCGAHVLDSMLAQAW